MVGRTRWLVALGSALVVGGAWFRRVVLPARPDDAPLPIPRRVPDPDARPSPDGAGARIVVNPSSGPMWTSTPTEVLRAGLPAAEIKELAEGDDVAALLSEDHIEVIGAAGGDGTLSAAARIAADRGVPLIAVPAGTLNHLARDLGLSSAEDAVEAVRAGTVAHMDLGMAADRPFVNTLSFGGYTAVVDTRERWERRIGKWPALLLALVRELPRMRPMVVEIDGRPERLWLAWVGNCAHAPDGFGPSWRERVDDGLLDVRLVTGHRRFSRARLVAYVLSGRLRRCPVYEERLMASVRFRFRDGAPRLAVDGETYDGPADLSVTKRSRALTVAVPPRS